MLILSSSCSFHPQKAESRRRYQVKTTSPAHVVTQMQLQLHGDSLKDRRRGKSLCCFITAELTGEKRSYDRKQTESRQVTKGRCLTTPEPGRRERRSTGESLHKQEKLHYDNFLLCLSHVHHRLLQLNASLSGHVENNNSYSSECRDHIYEDLISFWLSRETVTC